MYLFGILGVGEVRMKIAVIGTGYVGLITALTLSKIGHKVITFDIDKKKIENLKKGIPPIYENGVEEVLKERNLKVTYTSSYKEAIINSEIIFICVGTPEGKDGSANLTYVYDVCDAIIKHIKEDKIVVLKSTVPIGTNDKIDEYINSKLKNIKVEVVSNPEFLAQGTAMYDSLNPSRIVIGTSSKTAEKKMLKLYEKFSSNTDIVVTDRRSAEMIKYASNAFLALKITYINEMANICEKLGVNIEDVAYGMGLDSRIGPKFLKAGIGFGGSCFQKDTKSLYSISKKLNIDSKLLKDIIDINKNQKIKLILKFKEDFKRNYKNKNIAILGLSFKPKTDDMREAPSIDNINTLLKYKSNISVYDPIANENARKIFGDKITYCTSIDEAIKDKDAVFIMTEWSEIVNYDLKKYEKLMKTPYVYDGRNCYSLKDIQKYNITYKSIGRK